MLHKILCVLIPLLRRLLEPLPCCFPILRNFLSQQIELAEGAYTLIASKGDNKGAAFENPYFEGSTDFTIRGDMNTYIDVTCTLGNTRVVTESSKEFDDVYEDYTIVIKTPYTSEDGFEIEKGETSPAFFRADKEGTEAEVVVKLKKKGSTEEESFSSTAPETASAFFRPSSAQASSARASASL